MSLSRFAAKALIRPCLSRLGSSNAAVGVRGVAVSGLRTTRSTLPSPLFENQSVFTLATRTFSSELTGNQDTLQFLTEEIKAEKGNQKPLPKLEGFTVEADNADLVIKKEFNGEKIAVNLNVNHTVDSAEADDGTEEAPDMRSKPTFEVEITKPNGKTLAFTCSFIFDRDSAQEAAKDEGYDDIFSIEEVMVYDGEWNDKKYAVSGEILDGYLYDLLMNMLDARGINSEFAEKLSDYCSSYEHSLYINMLEELQQFFK